MLRCVPEREPVLPSPTCSAGQIYLAEGIPSPRKRTGTDTLTQAVQLTAPLTLFGESLAPSFHSIAQSTNPLANITGGKKIITDVKR